MRFSVLTPISDRAEAFDLLVECMRRQEFQGQGEWIVIDDSHVPVEIDPPIGNLQTKIIRQPPTDGEITIARNLLAGYRHVKSDIVVFCESQSWYRHDYLDTIVSAVEKERVEIAGAPYYRFYLLWTGAWVEEIEDPPRGAGLCVTAIRGNRTKELHQRMLQKCRADKGSGSCDTPLWAHRHLYQKAFVIDSGLTVNFKGIKGKVRYSSGGTHPKDIAKRRWGKVETSDPHGTKLCEWIGEDDARKYLSLAVK